MSAEKVIEPFTSTEEGIVVVRVVEVVVVTVTEVKVVEVSVVVVVKLERVEVEVCVANGSSVVVDVLVAAPVVVVVLVSIKRVTEGVLSARTMKLNWPMTASSAILSWIRIWRAEVSAVCIEAAIVGPLLMAVIHEMV
mmetsp:Transcript_9140/g.19194  ORF Transcript_9140/g.19194 Transcript_9140/m.19194 type:complete len:138 (+) Transcript_9140:1361-1774(+)